MLLLPCDLVLFYTWLGAPFCLVKIYDMLLLIISYQFHADHILTPPDDA